MSNSAKAKMFSISDVLNELLDQQHMSVSELARKINIPQPTIQRIVSGLHSRPHQKTLITIAEYFKISVDQICGREPIPALTPVFKGRSIPLLENSQLAIYPNIHMKNLPRVSIDTALGKNAFATKMPDGSMEPLISKDALLIIDPNRDIIYRSFVLVRIKKTNQVVVRQVIKDADKIYLRALSSELKRYDLYLLSKHDSVLGVVTEIRIHM